MAAASPVCGSQASAVGASSPPAPAPAPAAGLGRCRMASSSAVALDVAGMAASSTGVFAQSQVRGRDFGDSLIYSGASSVFLSSSGWILWYTGNIEISRQESERDYGLRPSAIARSARKSSRRWSAPATASPRTTAGLRSARRANRAPQPSSSGSRRVRSQLATLEAGSVAAGTGSE